ncbi:MAG: cupredoxin domain-containing protein [Alicyclobacillus sp.]|nr:cupredoxin domain-containing protein [Alicyclobacillus sp.]
MQSLRLLPITSALAVSLTGWAWFDPSPANAATRQVNIQITDRGFQPGQVIAMINQPLHLHVVNRGQRIHQFSIPDYRIYSANLQPGQMTDIEFAPWTPGRFAITSDPSGNNQPEFHGWLIVTDQK